MNYRFTLVALAVLLVPAFPVFAESMSMDSSADDMKAVEAMDAKAPKAQDMKMDEKKHDDAVKKARAKYDAALKKAQLNYLGAIKKSGKVKARTQLDKAKRDALSVYNKDKQQAMKAAETKPVMKGAVKKPVMKAAEKKSAMKAMK